jgi:hypothetical protein
MTHTLDFRAIELRVAELGGRAHLGKVAATTFRAYEFPCLPRFRTYRYERDPQNRFLTPFLAELIRQQTNFDNIQGEFEPAVNARLKSHQASQAFGLLAWILILAVIGGLSLYSHCIYDPNATQNHKYMSLPQPNPKMYYTTKTIIFL